MLTRWNEWNRPVRHARAPGEFVQNPNDLRHRMMRFFDEMESGLLPEMSRMGWPWGAMDYPEMAPEMPPFTMHDEGSHFLITLDAPGIQERNVELTVTDQTVTIRAHRELDTPEGYTVLRRERSPQMQMTRTLTLPTRIAADKSTARLQNGVLTIELGKTEESKPRTINVRGGR